MSIRVRSAFLRATELRKYLLLVFSILFFAIPFHLTAALSSGANLGYGCSSGSGTCFDTFSGASGMDLASYNANWILISGIGKAHTTGSNSAAVEPGRYAFYRYAPSNSETSQITVDPSASASDYTRDACVRMSSGIEGYCVGFTGSSKGFYSNCVIEKSGQYIGNGSCGPIDSTKSHTLAITASGKSKTTLAIYLDGSYTGSVTDSSQPYTIAGSGFALEGGASDANSWHDFRVIGTAAASTSSYGCSSGSGTCFDKFAGASGTDLATYNPSWALISGIGKAYTTGADSAAVGSGLYAFYHYVPSTSETSRGLLLQLRSREGRPIYRQWKLRAGKFCDKSQTCGHGFRHVQGDPGNLPGRRVYRLRYG
jgi:hypothetical protein